MVERLPPLLGSLILIGIIYWHVWLQSRRYVGGSMSGLFTAAFLNRIGRDVDLSECSPVERLSWPDTR
jgi:hypothetical protein